MRIPLLGALLGLVLLVTACGGSSRSPFLAEGRDLFTANGCSTCHGGRGEGGVGPALANVASTFPECDTQVEWVTLGSAGWQAVHGDTYGATDKPVEGGMLAFAEKLSDTQIRTVVAYERTDFGGLDEQDVRSDCDV